MLDRRSIQLERAEPKQSAYTHLLAFEAALTRRYGLSRMERYARAWQYYSGAFAPPMNTDQPLGINLVKALCDKHNSYLWGRWRDTVVKLRVVPEDAGDQKEVECCGALTRWLMRCFFRDNEGNVILPDGGLNASIFGDAFLRLDWDEELAARPGTTGVRLTTVPPEYVHFRWHPNDSTRITEVIIAYPIDRKDAYALYGTYGNPGALKLLAAQAGRDLGFGRYWERWTEHTFEIWIDDVAVKTVGGRPLSNDNPYVLRNRRGQVIGPGFIPVVHVQNLPGGGEVFGFSDAEMLQLLQDEFNRKMSDQGDIINAHAHPITLINNYYGEIDDLPVGPDEVWDMGKEGSAQYLEWKGTPPEVFRYLELLLQTYHDVGSLPQAAFGRAHQSQLSGVAAQMAMLPIIERAETKRVLWTAGLRKAARLALRIAWTRDRRRLPTGVDLDFIETHEIQVQWAPILPKDRAAIVNENIALFVNGLRSLKDCLVALDEDDVERKAQEILDERMRLAQLGLLPNLRSGGGAAVDTETTNPRQQAEAGTTMHAPTGAA